MPASYNPPVTPFLDKEGRAEWFNKRVQFNVIDAEAREGEFGPTATYKLERLDGEAPAVVYFAVALTDQKTGATIVRRMDEFNWFRDTLADTADHAVGPLVLSQTETKKGNPAWGFAGAE